MLLLFRIAKLFWHHPRAQFYTQNLNFQSFISFPVPLRFKSLYGLSFLILSKTTPTHILKKEKPDTV